MIPYYRGLILDHTNKYGITKTEIFFELVPLSLNSYPNTMEPLESILKKKNNMLKFKQDTYDSSRSLKVHPDHNIQRSVQRNHSEKPKRKSKGEGHKCIPNLKKIKRRKKFIKLHKKYLIPLILGLLAAKSLLLPIALKTIAFMSAKGLMMSFFSTVLAALLTLKGILDHSYGYQNRKDDSKTQVEIFHIPTKSSDHFYHDKYRKRNDVFATNMKKEETKKNIYYKGETENHKSQRNNNKN